MNLKARVCPDCGNNTFHVDAIESVTWEVDEYGGFNKFMSSNDGYIAEMAIFYCAKCGTDCGDEFSIREAAA